MLKLSPKQKEFILNSTAKINIAHGSVRAGKTFSTLYRFGELCITCPDSKIYMIGKSLRSIMDNAVKPFMDEMFKGFCSWSSHKSELTFGDKIINVVGANDEGAIGRIAGNTHSLTYCDEMTLLPKNFMDMLYSRLSEPHSKLIGTCNADAPGHPIKTLIDKADGKFVYQLPFRLNDNPHLSQDYIEMIEKLYTGLWYKRYILGLWVLAEGAIYESFDRSMHVLNRIPSYGNYYIVGVDYGSRNPFAAVLIGVSGGVDVSPPVWVEDEYYWDPKVTARGKTDHEFGEDLARFVANYPVRCIYIDPSAQSFELELRKRRLPVKEADNDVNSGIRKVGSMFHVGDLQIHQRCKNLIREIEGYVWDEKAAKKGEDDPVKENDHAVDALRYAIYTHFKGKFEYRPKEKQDEGFPHWAAGWRKY